jgi:hypothetical protein
MRVRIVKSRSFNNKERRAVNAYHGWQGLATRDTLASLLERFDDDDLYTCIQEGMRDAEAADEREGDR